MANETYLSLVNSVMKRLREPTVTSVSQNTLSSLVGEFVNEAKSLVERAHDWKSLESTVTVNTVASTKVYSLTGVGDDPKFLLAYNSTNKFPLKLKAYSEIQEKYIVSGSVSGTPLEFGFEGVDSNGDLEIETYPTPNAVETLTFRVKSFTEDLSDENDTIVVPARPIIQVALAMSIAERGEEGSLSAVEQMALADRFVADYVATASNSTPGKYDWSPQ